MDFSNLSLYAQDIIDEHIYHMETRGYSVFPNFFSNSICDELKKHLNHEVENYVPFGNERSILDKYHMHDLLCKNLIFAKTLEDIRLQQIVAAILGDFWIMYAYTSSSVPAKGSNYGGRIHVDSPRYIQNYTTNVGVLWALDDFTLENGGTKLLPASHHSSKVPSEELFEKNCITVTCPKGTLLVFNARVFHRAGVNNTNNIRHSLTMNVCRPYMKQRCDWVRFLPIEITSQLNSQARRIIGFDTRLPTSLEEFFVSDENRLYKPNQE